MLRATIVRDPHKFDERQGKEEEKEGSSRWNGDARVKRGRLNFLSYALPWARPGQFLPNVFNPVNGRLAFSVPACGNVPLIL